MDDIPTNVPTLGQDHFRTLESWARQYSDEPLFPTGTTVTCPSCGQPTMVYTNDLTFDAPQRIGFVMVTHLPGAECTTCGAKSFGGAAQKHIALARAKAPRIVQEATVTSLGGKQPGLYFKQGLQEITGIVAGERLRIYVTDDGNLFIERLETEKSKPK